MAIRVLTVDDHALVRAGIAAMIANETDIAVVAEASDAGLVTSALRDDGVRVDYATIGALHLANPAWDIPVVSLSANNNPYFYSDAALDEMETLGAATARAIERTGRRAVLLASNSLSHLHWDHEPDLPEDMGVERPFDQLRDELGRALRKVQQ